MLSLRIHMEFEASACDEAVASLRSLIGPVRAEPDCRSTRILHGDDSEACGLIWAEEWRSLEGFEQHLRGASFRRILAVMDMASAPPEVEVDEVASRRGFELVEEILGRPPVERSLSGAGAGDDA
jgi:quinol monooxygenase YgiN